MPLRRRGEFDTLSLSDHELMSSVLSYLSPDAVTDFDRWCVNPYTATSADDDEEASIGDINERPVDHLHEHRLEPVPRPLKRKTTQGRTTIGDGGGENNGGGDGDDQDDDLQWDDFKTEEEWDVIQLKKRSVIAAGVESIKYLFSFILVSFAVAATVSTLLSRQTEWTATAGGHGSGAAAVFAFFALLLWLAVLEGSETCLVGLRTVEGGRFADSHPLALRTVTLVKAPDDMERFVIGRQFLVAFAVFALHLVAGPLPDAAAWGLSDPTSRIFLGGGGVALILTVVVVGQLTAQVHASTCKLDFLNGYSPLFATYLSLAVEASGLLHCVYFAQWILDKIAGREAQMVEPTTQETSPRSFDEKVSFVARSVFSLSILGLAFFVAICAIFEGRTTTVLQGHAIVSIFVFLLLVCFIGMMEGMQTAVSIVSKMPEEHIPVDCARAVSTCELGLRGENADDFRMGRHICVTVCTLLMARMTTLVYVLDAEGDGADEPSACGLKSRILMALLGAVIATVSSLVGRIVAASLPLTFLSNPMMYYLIRLCIILEASSVCSAAWLLARYQRLLVLFQPDEVYLDGHEPPGCEPITRRDKDMDRLVTIVKYCFSFILLCVSVVVMAATFVGQTRENPENLLPIVSFGVFWFLLVWLAMMEGGQGCLISLESINKDKYAASHPLALKNVTLAHSGDNIERFIMGRQFLVFLIVFVVNLMCQNASATSGANFLGLPGVIDDFFLSTGMAMIFTTIIIGQLMSQVNAAVCMLDVINNYLMLFTTYVSLGIELSGILHFVYVVKIVFSKITGQPITSKENPRTVWQNIFFWLRVLMSFVILGASFAITLVALFRGKTTAWKGVPGGVLVVAFFLLMCFVGLFEGIQIALFAVYHMPKEAIAKSKVAKANCDLAFRDQNLQALLIGRQFCVTTTMFVVARITTLNLQDGETIFGMPRGMQNLLNTGLLGAVITTIVASLAWRIVASSFPLAFLSNPLIYLIIRLCLFVEASGVCSAAWILARHHKTAVGYQADEVYLEGAPKHTSAPANKREKDIDITVTVIKYLYSTTLLIFSLSLVVGVILSEQTRLTQNSRPYAAFIIFWFLLAWLAVMEGGQGCLIGLQRVDKSAYAESHPVALKCTTLSHRGDNMERFIIGRQFLVFMVVFITNLCLVLNAPEDHLDKFLLSSGAAIMLTTIILGQLTAQVTAANCMLDFINSRFMLFTTYVSLLIEVTGLLHASYFFQAVFSKIARVPIEKVPKEAPRNAFQKTFFWGRVVVSLVILVFSFAATLTAIFQGKTTVWDGVPVSVSVMLFFGLMGFVGLMEGLQIALFQCINMPDENFANAKVAKANRDLAFRGQNLQAILIGRQICVTTCMFVFARITTMSFHDGETVFGVSQGLQEVFNTGLLGTIIATIVASLSWRIVASSFPLAFLSNPLIYVIMRLCLLLEKSGICSASWLFALFHKSIAGFRVDEVYIGTNDENADMLWDEGLGEERDPVLNKVRGVGKKALLDEISHQLEMKSTKVGGGTRSFRGGKRLNERTSLKDVGSGKKLSYHSTDIGNASEYRTSSKPMMIPARGRLSREDTDCSEVDDDALHRAQENRYARATWKMHDRIMEARNTQEAILMASYIKEQIDAPPPQEPFLMPTVCPIPEENSSAPDFIYETPPENESSVLLPTSVAPSHPPAAGAIEDDNEEVPLLLRSEQSFMYTTPSENDLLLLPMKDASPPLRGDVVVPHSDNTKAPFLPSKDSLLCSNGADDTFRILKRAFGMSLSSSDDRGTDDSSPLSQGQQGQNHRPSGARQTATLFAIDDMNV